MKIIDIEISKLQRKYDLLSKKIDIHKLICSLSTSGTFSYNLEKLESRIMIYLPNCILGKLRLPSSIDLINCENLPEILLLCWNIMGIHNNIKKLISERFDIDDNTEYIDTYTSIYYKDINDLFEELYGNNMMMENRDKIEEYYNDFSTLDFYKKLDADYDKIKNALFMSLCFIIIIDLRHYQFLVTKLFLREVERDWTMLKHIPIYNESKYIIIVDRAMDQDYDAVNLIPDYLKKKYEL